MDSRKTNSLLWEGCASPQGSKWLADNLEAVDENVKLMLKLIEDDVDSFAKKADLYYQKRPQLISCVDELHGQYCLLAERYYHLFKELHKNSFQGLQSQTSGKDVYPTSQFSSPVTKSSAYQSVNQSTDSHANVISPDSSSDLSLKTGSGSSSASLSNMDSEFFNSVSNLSFSSRIQQNIADMEAEYATMNGKCKLSEEQQAVPKTDLNADVEGNCGDLLGRIKEYEEELKSLSLKLQLSEEEATDYKFKAENDEVVIADLKSRLQLAHMDVEEQRAVLALEKEKVVELQRRLSVYVRDVSSYEGTVIELKAALCHVQEHLFVSVAQLESDIGNLLDQKNQLEAELVECKLETASLDTELQECKEQKTSLKNRYDMLAAEKDEMAAQLQTLTTEVDSRNSMVTQLEDLVNRKEEISAKLKSMREEVMAKTNSLNKLVDDLRLQLLKKEEESERQKALINEGAEMKREAIRQLCFSLDHYKSGYKELCQAFLVPKSRPVSAS